MIRSSHHHYNFKVLTHYLPFILTPLVLGAIRNGFPSGSTGDHPPSLPMKLPRMGNFIFSQFLWLSRTQGFSAGILLIDFESLNL